MIDKFEHIPVMLQEALDSLHPEQGDIFVDCTLGGAGHSVQVAKRLGKDGLLIGIDQDPHARKFAREKLESLKETCSDDPNIVIANANFSELDEVLLNIPVAGVDCILFDLGVSSVQLDVLERGFSYHEGAPLDMRMNTEVNDLTAEIIVNDYSETELERILRVFGEEKCSKQIARNICKTRETERIKTSDQLVEIIKSSIPNKMRRSGGHPAKRTFQALRIAVNDELSCLEKALSSAVRWLNVGGRVCVISYHSLEDRRVKDAFRNFENRCTCPPETPVCICQKEPILKTKPRGVILPSEAEIKNNPRARSAKMRCAIKVKD
jgi:16S rRNA (cytosine1402-N4)-methyltransferase